MSTAWAHLHRRGLGAELYSHPVPKPCRERRTAGNDKRTMESATVSGYVLTHIARTHVTLKHPSFDPNLYT